MQRASLTIRWKAATLLLCLLALQVHFFAESIDSAVNPHECQVCKTGACVVPTPSVNLTVALHATPLLDEFSLPLVHAPLSDASAPRAPPQN
jgi:hypothetical protein